MRSIDDVLMFKRSHRESELQIALLFSQEPRKVEFEGEATLLVSTHLDRQGCTTSTALSLRGDEGVVLKAQSRAA
jgi:hypothetical protein